MAHYRKIDVKIWNDSRVSELKPPAKLAFLFLITHPNMTSLGVMRGTIQGLSAELGVSPKDFLEVISAGMAKYDEKALCVFLPNFLKYQTAESPNVIKNWVKQLEYIPEGQLRNEALDSLIASVEGMAKGFQEAFRKAFRKAFPEAFREAFGEALQEGLREGYPNTVSSKQLAVKKPYLANEREVTTEKEGGEVAKVFGVVA